LVPSVHSSYFCLEIFNEGLKILQTTEEDVSRTKLMNNFDNLNIPISLQHKKLDLRFASSLFVVPENGELHVSARSTQSESTPYISFFLFFVSSLFPVIQ
jgi:hypothetical protein